MAQREIESVSAELIKNGRITPRNTSIRVKPTSLFFRAVRQRLTLAGLASLIALLLVFICTIGVLQVRAIDRIGEIRIRQALGAGPYRIIRMLLAENLVLFLFAAGAGAVLASGIVQVWGPPIADGIGLPPAFARNTARWLPFGMFGLVPLFSLAACIAELVVLAPTIHAPNIPTRAAWTPGRLAFRELLVILQGSAAVCLTLAAVASIHALLTVERRELGFDTDLTLSARVTLGQLPSDSSRWDGFYDSLVSELKGLPGVRSVGVIFDQVGENRLSDVFQPVEPLVGVSGPVMAREQIVHRTFFREMGIPALAGRTCENARPEGDFGIAVINEAMARAYWPTTNPVGKHLDVHRRDPVTIVGVVPSWRNSVFDASAVPEVFVCSFSLAQMHVLIRHSGQAKLVESSLLPVARGIDKQVAVDDIVPVSELLGRSLRPARVLTSFLSSLGTMSLVVSTLGLFGIAAFTIEQRRPELAIRLALGADPAHLGWTIEREALVLGAASIVGGRLLYAVLIRLGASSGADLSLPWSATIASGMGVLLAMWLAVKWPAGRLRRMNVMNELKQE